jgi:hypothetical protein
VSVWADHKRKRRAWTRLTRDKFLSEGRRETRVRVTTREMRHLERCAQPTRHVRACVCVCVCKCAAYFHWQDLHFWRDSVKIVYVMDCVSHHPEPDPATLAPRPRSSVSSHLALDVRCTYPCAYLARTRKKLRKRHLCSSQLCLVDFYLLTVSIYLYVCRKMFFSL